jgi:hypothetical protein
VRIQAHIRTSSRFDQLAATLICRFYTYYVNSYVLGWNTKLVKREDVSKNYDALLNPKSKGSFISLDTEAYGMFEGLKGAWGTEKMLAYFKWLAASIRCSSAATPNGSRSRLPASIRSASPQAPMILVDAGPLVAVTDEDDNEHERCREAFERLANRWAQCGP